MSHLRGHPRGGRSGSGRAGELQLCSAEPARLVVRQRWWRRPHRIGDRLERVSVCVCVAEPAFTVVVCGRCGARFSTSAPRDFIQRVRRCGECGERSLVIEDGSDREAVGTEGTSRDGREPARP